MRTEQRAGSKSQHGWGLGEIRTAGGELSEVLALVINELLALRQPQSEVVRIPRQGCE